MPPVMGVARARQLGPEGSFTRALRIAVAGGQDGWTEVAWEAPASDAQRSPRQVCYGPANNVRCMTLETIVLPSDSSAVGLPLKVLEMRNYEFDKSAKPRNSAVILSVQ